MQSVNLYTKEFQPDTRPLLLPTMLMACAAFILLLMGFSVWYQYDGRNTAAELLAHKVRAAELESERNRLENQSRSLDTGALDEEIAHVRQTISQRRALMNLISNQNFGQRRGFSHQLRALAYHSDSSISLSTFALGGVQPFLELTGQVQLPLDVARYIDALQRDAAFSNTRFGVIAIEPHQQSYDFSVVRPGAEQAQGGVHNEVE